MVKFQGMNAADGTTPHDRLASQSSENTNVSDFELYRTLLVLCIVHITYPTHTQFWYGKTVKLQGMNAADGTTPHDRLASQSSENTNVSDFE